jgi:hypothetical protein
MARVRMVTIEVGTQVRGNKNHLLPLTWAITFTIRIIFI